MGDAQVAERALAALGRARPRAATHGSLTEALTAVAATALATTGADLVVVRVLGADGTLVARVVAGGSPAISPEIEGTRFLLEELSAEEVDTLDALPAAVARIAVRAGARAVLQLPVLLAERVVGSLELLRGAGAFVEGERVLARLAADEAALTFAVHAGRDGATALPPEQALALAAEGLTAGAADGQAPELIARLAAQAAGARSCLIWRVEGAGPVLVAATDGVEGGEHLELLAAAAARALESRDPVVLEEGPRTGELTATLPLGRPASGALQLSFDLERALSDTELHALAGFGRRAGEVLRTGERTRELAHELERTRALLAVVGQAIAQLSLSHTLETAIDRVAALLGVEQLAVYLREEGRLAVAAEKNLVGAHAEVAEHLLELALGPFRARGQVAFAGALEEPRLTQVRGALTETGIEAVHAVPLLAHDDLIGLFAVYPQRGRSLTEGEADLLQALAGQLAVAVENARLHEHTKQLGMELEDALTAERLTSRRLGALYEISRSFVEEELEELSLEMTLDAVARTIVELLEVDAAVIRTLDERGESLVAEAIHVANPRLDQAVRSIFERPEPATTPVVRRLLRRGVPFRLDPTNARELAGSHELLVPFLEKGSTAVVLPIATPNNLLASLTILSLDPARPITAETAETAMSVAAQAALAIDNARLYQQQKQFADSIQSSLLPRAHPDVPGLELGEAYESSARLDVGGDLYDYLLLGESRLAVVLGDVTGHGIDAAADMAMAKFVFRSLAREHPEPGDLLAAANEVVCGEVAAGKFVTMLYLTIDAEAGELACASAGHPPPRLLLPDGAMEPVPARGLALGIEPSQTYEEVRLPFAPGTTVVLYTDGVVEARRDGELYGVERLDRLLVERRALPPAELARAVLADCRRFGGGVLTDDCAAVVVRRLAV